MGHIIASANIKGGTGKTAIVVLLVNWLVRLGKKVLLIDLDFNNSSSFSFLRSDDNSLQNIVRAFMEDNIKDQIIYLKENFGIVQSHFGLLKLGTLPYQSLKLLLSEIVNDWDYIVLDTNPHFTNIEKNAYLAGDMIICPVEIKDINCLKCVEFMINQLEIEIPSALPQLHLLYNFYKESKETKEFDLQYRDLNINIFNTVIPATQLVQDSVNYSLDVKNNKTWSLLYPSIQKLGIEIITILDGEEEANRCIDLLSEGVTNA